MTFLLLRSRSGRAQRHSRPYGLLALIVNLWFLCAAPALAQAVTLLAVGDSLTAGYGLAQTDSFTTQLERALRGAGADVRVINSGVSGDTSAGGRARLAWSLSEKPDAVMIELGANDGLRGLDPAETEANLDAMIVEVKKQGLPVLLTGMLAPPNLGTDYGTEFNGLYPRLAKKHGVLFYPFFLEGVAAVPALNQPDAIHPNAAGVAEIVKRILPTVRKLIGEVR